MESKLCLRFSDGMRAGGNLYRRGLDWANGMDGLCFLSLMNGLVKAFCGGGGGYKRQHHRNYLFLYMKA